MDSFKLKSCPTTASNQFIVLASGDTDTVFCDFFPLVLVPRRKDNSKASVTCVCLRADVTC